MGLMGAGKSTVGPVLAQRMGWRFVDLDREIEQLAGRTVQEVFATRGEAGFRGLEVEATERLADSSAVVIAAGGGWMAQAAMPERLGSGTFLVWLQVTPEVAIARLGAGDTGRPLLTGAQPVLQLERLLEDRQGAYSRANAVVATDGLRPAAVAAAVERVLAERHL